MPLEALAALTGLEVCNIAESALLGRDENVLMVLENAFSVDA